MEPLTLFTMGYFKNVIKYGGHYAPSLTLLFFCSVMIKFTRVIENIYTDDVTSEL